MYSLKSKNLAWLATATMLLFTAACPVDANEDPYTIPVGETDCDAPTARVRILQGALGLGRIVREGYPPVNQTVVLRRTFVNDPAKTAAVASLGLNGTANVAVCSGTTTVSATMTVLGADNVMLETASLGTTELVVADNERITLVVTGTVTGTGDAGLKFIVVREPAEPEDATSKVMVVNASPDSPTLAVDINADGTVDIPALARYAVSELTPVASPGGEIDLEVLEGTTPKAQFTISRFPAGANLVAVIYNNLTIPAMATKPPARVFLTGSDPLIGNVPGNGIFVTAN